MVFTVAKYFKVRSYFYLGVGSVARTGLVSQMNIKSNHCFNYDWPLSPIKHLIFSSYKIETVFITTCNLQKLNILDPFVASYHHRKGQTPYDLMVLADTCWLFNVNCLLRMQFKVCKLGQFFQIDVGIFTNLLPKHQTTVLKFLR